MFTGILLYIYTLWIFLYIEISGKKVSTMYELLIIVVAESHDKNDFFFFSDYLTIVPIMHNFFTKEI